MFSIYGKLILALKKVWIVKITPKISSGVGEPYPPPTPYRYLDNPAISDNGKLSGDAFADPIIPF